jgi:regulator of protease activity HflC (stomatin/prohibitin superfamily)
MISTAIIILGLLLTGIYALNKFKSNSKPNGGLKTSFIINIIIGVVVTLSIAIIQPYSVEKIDSSGVGLKVNLVGNNRGVSDYQYVTGWIIYNSWTEQVIEYPTFQQHAEFSEQTVITKGGFQTTIEPTFNYALRKDAVGDMFINLRKPLDELESGWLKTAVVGSINDVANNWTVDSIFNHRESFEGAIQAECNERIGKWFTLDQLKTNITPPPSLTVAIESETQSIKMAQAEVQKALAAEAKAKTIIATAKGDSAKLVIEASSQALAMKLKQEQITPLYIEFLKASRWDGVMPTTILSDSKGTIVNLK